MYLYLGVYGRSGLSTYGLADGSFDVAALLDGILFIFSLNPSPGTYHD
jgi:hypothetical protein